MFFRILGPIELLVDGRSVPLRTTKVRGLLAILLLNANKPIAADVIVNRLWDDEYVRYSAAGRTYRPDRRQALQTNVTRLRAVLKRAGLDVHRVQHGYRIDVDESRIDYQRFGQLTRQARGATRQGDHRRVVALLDEAVDMWRAEPFADLTTSWAQQRRAMMTDNDFLPACYQLVDAHLALHQYEEALTRLQPLITEHSVNETFAVQWMRATEALSGPAPLSDFHHAFVQRFQREMGVEPHQVTTQYRLLTPQRAVAAARQPRIVKPDQLPRPTPYFTGRRDMVAKLDELLVGNASVAPVVAIDGQAGVGKSTLAIHWANSRRDHFPDGQLFAKLAGYGPSPAMSATAVMTSFLTALGVPAENLPGTPEGCAALLRTVLSNRRILIVLDNARNSDHVRPILAATPTATVLVTSRQKLSGLVLEEGARPIVLSKLHPQESVSLLVNRLGPARARHDSPAIQDLADFCDGHPLGLVIAAEYVATSAHAPLRQLVTTLRRQPPLLLDTGIQGDKGANSLRTVLSWSYLALPPTAQTMFVRLGLHPTTEISVGAAAALAGVSAADAASALDRLQGGHLIEQEAPGRFRCHDLIFLLAGALAGELDATTRDGSIHRMLDWYLGTITNAARCLDPEQTEVPPLAIQPEVTPDSFHDTEEALRWCVEQRLNLLSIIRLAADSGRHAYVHADAHAWRLVGRFESVLHRYGSPAEMVEVIGLGLVSARACHSQEGEAGMLNSLATRHLQLGDHALAGRYFEEARTLYHQIGDGYSEGICLMNTGTAWLARGRFQMALERLEQALELLDRIGEPISRTYARQRLGDTYRKMGRTTPAANLYRAALALHEEAGNRQGQADVLTALGELHLELKEPTAAISCCGKAISLHVSTLDQRRAADAHLTMASALIQVGRPADAIPVARSAIDRYLATGNDRGRAGSLDVLGQAHAAAGHLDQAKAAWSDAIRWYEEVGDPAAEDVRLEIDGINVAPVPARRRTERGGSLLP